MSYSDSFPTQRPKLNLVFNGGSDQLDSRLSYSRSSGGTYMSNEKSLNSENLLLQSQDFDTSWTASGISAPTGSQTAPDGTSTAWLLTSTTFTAGSARVQQSIPISTNTEYTMVAHVKAGTASHAFMSFRGASTQSCSVTLNFSTQALTNTAFNFTNVSSSVTALGNSWFKLTLTGTTDNSTVSAIARLGLSDGSAVAAAGNPSWNASGETMYAWGAQLSSTNSKVYDSPTTTQISREYSPLLKTASADSPRFEYASDGQSVGSGTAKGLLIEAQSSNLATYGSDLTNAAWNPLSAFIGGTTVGPDGTLSAVKLVASAGSGFYPRFRRLSLLTDTTQTFSIYVKPLEFQHLAIAADGSTSSLVQYNLSGNGAITSQTGATGSVEQCGNGWFRVSFSYTTVPNAHLAITMQSSTTYQTEAGNGYDGMLFAMAQLENSSHASSFIGTTSSTVTRAADSCSVADFGYTGGPVSVVSETSGGYGSFPGCWVIKNSTGSEALQLYKQSAAATEATDFRVYANSGGTNTVDTLITSSASAGKIAVSYGTNDVAFTASGNAVQTDTSASSIGAVDTLIIGAITTTNQLNGHIKRLSLFNVALSDAELKSLTSS
jgi:hypothetical protein